MKRIEHVDLYAKNEIEPLGFKNRTEEQMIALAIEHRCPIIVKGSKNGITWYLKGKGKTYEELEQIIKKNENNPRWKNCYVILIKYE
jgi:hypothetical protein